MMEKERTTRRSLLRALYLLPLVCISLALNAQTKVVYVNGNAPSGQTPQKVVGKATLTYDTLKYDVTIYYDLIKSLPGAEIDDDGNITINGKPVSKVLMDGKTVYENKDSRIPDHTIRMNYTADKDIEEEIRNLPGVEIDDDGYISVNGKPVRRILVNGKEYNSGDPDNIYASRIVEEVEGEIPDGHNRVTTVTVNENGQVSITSEDKPEQAKPANISAKNIDENGNI